MSEVNKERVKLFVDALPNYRQDTGALCEVFEATGERGYCCLGVATQIAVDNGLKLTEVFQESTVHGTYSGSVGWKDPENPAEGTVFSVLPQAVADWYGFDLTTPRIKNHPEWGASDRDQCDDPKCDSCGGNQVDTVSAVTANDRLKWDFAQIAQAFRETYLED